MQIWILASNVYGFSANNLSIDSGSSSQSISMKRARSYEKCANCKSWPSNDTCPTNSCLFQYNLFVVKLGFVG